MPQQGQRGAELAAPSLLWAVSVGKPNLSEDPLEQLACGTGKLTFGKPRVFVSSTYYDLKHIRSSLELFIESIGYEPVLSEKGDIAYLPDNPLDESCYREAASADIFVLVIGGRYGSASSQNALSSKPEFYDRYESITRREYETVNDSGVPVFILIEAPVHSEYRTYLQNKDRLDIKYAHADSVNIFRFIEVILNQPMNNPLFSFERSSQIEGWLREQWAGLFRELLRSRSQQKQLVALTGQVAELKVVSGTLKHYMEEVLKGVAPKTSDELIEFEERRLSQARAAAVLRGSAVFRGIGDLLLDEAEARTILLDSKSLEDAVKLVSASQKASAEQKSRIIGWILRSTGFQEDWNSLRESVGVPPISFQAVNARADVIESQLKKGGQIGTF